MNYLLDTQILIWLFENNPLLSRQILEIIQNPNNSVFVSIASIWEIAIKINIKKLKLRFDFDEIFDVISQYKCEVMPIKQDHLEQYTHLELIHRDPFDRLLIATAISEKLTIITADENIHKYNVDWVW